MTRTPAEWASALYRAGIDRKPIDPISDAAPETTLHDAYEIQRRHASLLAGADGRTVGFKLGLTSKPMQDLLGVAEPDFGPILSSMTFETGTSLELDRFIQPRVEAEIGLVLGAPLRGPGVSRDDARAVVRGAVPAIELVDSRIKDWKIRLVDTIADLASSAAIITGGPEVPIETFDLRLCGMVITRNGELVETGAGAAALGDPLVALAWLANTLAGLDTTLEAGWLVMTGALHRAFPVHRGDSIRADFDRLGSVAVVFD